VPQLGFESVGFEMGGVQPGQVNYGAFTTMGIYGAAPTSDGGLSNPHSGTSAKQVAAAHQHGDRAALVVGGQGTGGEFVAATASSAKLKRLESAVANRVSAGHYDAVNVDWEEHVGSHKDQYRDLVAGLSTRLSVPVTVDVDPGQVPPTLIAAIDKHISRVDVMSYKSDGSAMTSAYISAGVPPRKVLIGIGVAGSYRDQHESDVAGKVSYAQRHHLAGAELWSVGALHGKHDPRVAPLARAVTHATAGAVSSSAPRSSAGGSSGRVKLALPAYMPAGSPEWSKVIHAGTKISAVIVNPSNGPGKHKVEGFEHLVSKLRHAGQRVYGYVSTKYGHRDPKAVKGDITRYRDWYGVRNIFLDEVPSGTGQVSLYRRYAKSVHQDGGKVVLNPGTVPAKGYFTFADAVVTFEDLASNWSQHHAQAPGWLAQVPASKRWELLKGASASQLPTLLASVPAGSTVDVTDSDWTSLPSYLSGELSAITNTGTPPEGGGR
jgi:hypothetical protein